MTWTRLSDNFADHPDVLALSDAAFRVHVCALVWCNKQLTDGHVPARAVALFTPDPDVVAELVEHELWTDVGNGYQLDWSDQEPAERVTERRDDWRRRDERRRLHNKGDHSTCDPKRCRVLLTRESRGETTRESRPPAPSPAPSPVPTPREGRGEGEIGSADAPSARAPGASRSEKKKPGPWDHLDNLPDPAPEPAPEPTFPGRGEGESLSDYMRRVNLTPFVLVEDDDEEQTGGAPA